MLIQFQTTRCFLCVSLCDTRDIWVVFSSPKLNLAAGLRKEVCFNYVRRYTEGLFGLGYLCYEQIGCCFKQFVIWCFELGQVILLRYQSINIFLKPVNNPKGNKIRRKNIRTTHTVKSHTECIKHRNKMSQKC